MVWGAGAAVEAHSRQGVRGRCGCSGQEGRLEAHPGGGPAEEGCRPGSREGAPLTQLHAVLRVTLQDSVVIVWPSLGNTLHLHMHIHCWQCAGERGEDQARAHGKQPRRRHLGQGRCALRCEHQRWCSTPCFRAGHCRTLTTPGSTLLCAACQACLLVWVTRALIQGAKTLKHLAGKKKVKVLKVIIGTAG